MERVETMIDCTNLMTKCESEFFRATVHFDDGILLIDRKDAPLGTTPEPLELTAAEFPDLMELLVHIQGLLP